MKLLNYSARTCFQFTRDADFASANTDGSQRLFLEIFVFVDASLSATPRVCVRASHSFCNYSAKFETPSPWSLCIRRRRRVSCDYKVNAAASDGREGVRLGGMGEVAGWEGLHADMHSIRMIYANYAHYSRRNLSSQSARINCRKLAIKFTVRGV